MRISCFVGTSLDGFIARENGTFDFLATGGTGPHGFEEFLATVDAVVMGRATYETVLGLDPWPYGDKPVIVLSNRPLTRQPAGRVPERLAGAPAAIVAGLAAAGLREIYLDGGLTIQQFLRAGLIQRLIVSRVPVLIGSGIPLFGAIPHDLPLQHVATRVYATGLVQSEYLVVAAATQTGINRRSP